METIIETVDENFIDEKIIAKAGEIIKAGGLVAFPTETVYGLGGDALNSESSKKIYAAKYSINTSGTVKSNGKVVSPPQTTTQVQNYSVPAQPQNYGTYSQYSSPNPYQNYGMNQNYGYNQNYNVYNAQPYVSNNQVNVMPVQNIELVMDYSGSMSDVVEVAKNTMANGHHGRQ